MSVTREQLYREVWVEPNRWQAYTPPLRATILRFEAQLALEANDISQAKRLGGTLLCTPRRSSTTCLDCRLPCCQGGSRSGRSQRIGTSSRPTTRAGLGLELPGAFSRN